MTTTARHYALQVRSLVTRLDEHHHNAVATLCQPEASTETCRALQDARMTLEAELKHAAAQLASVVLAEKASEPEPTVHCGAEFARNVCDLPKGHAETHHDTRTELRWD